MMKRDFTLSVYKELLEELKNAGYQFYTFEKFCQNKPQGKIVILRHDVDLKPKNSYETAKIENELSICSSYYFRIVPQSNKPHVIKEIAALGHEIGYHYEDLVIAKGNKYKAIEHFIKHLEYFRNFYPVCTICMHGSPTSRFDNKRLWVKYDYHDYGILGEPYFDINFNQCLYLTDTGRCWNGSKFSIRDKVSGKYNFNFKSTFEIIRAIEDNTLPDQIMIATHPQRWSDSIYIWTKELILQNIKNIIKYFIKD